jgi:CBS-domain-containing membrane protein
MPPVLVKHIMSTQVVTFFPEQTLPLAEEVMRLHEFRHLPVIDSDRRLIGLISQRDVLRAEGSTLRIGQLMTRDLWTVSPETLASRAGRMLIDHAFSSLPVIDARRVLVGIVTERDFLRAAIHAFEAHDGPCAPHLAAGTPTRRDRPSLR